MSRFVGRLRMPAVLAGLTLLLTCGDARAALSTSTGTGDEAGGMVWVYFAAFILGTLGLAFMPSKRKESE